VFTSCTGAQAISGLTQGTDYYIRVFAYNSVGFGPMAALAQPFHPRVAPGRPTSVSLVVVSGSSLRVIFSSPLDDGGDTVTAYRVEWSTDAAFVGASHHDVLYLPSEPYHYNIQGLDKGTTYYVRVSAGNAQGFGEPQAPTPASEHPRELPSAPIGAVVGVTSGRSRDGKVTIQWQAPLDDGGDPVTAYKITWDTVYEMNSFESLPHKGSATVLASEDMSYTVSDLQVDRNYFFRVASVNLVGSRPIPMPLQATPTLQPPGKPSSVVVDNTVSCGSSPCLQVRWNFPRIPHHGLFCGGGGSDAPSTPKDCPVRMGRTVEADGGANITSYIVQWSTVADFSVTSPPHYGDMVLDEADFGSGEPFSLDVVDLTAGLPYYVRVAAINSQGIGRYQTRGGLIGDGDVLTASPVAV